MRALGTLGGGRSNGLVSSIHSNSTYEFSVTLIRTQRKTRSFTIESMDRGRSTPVKGCTKDLKTERCGVRTPSERIHKKQDVSDSVKWEKQLIELTQTDWTMHRNFLEISLTRSETFRFDNFRRWVFRSFADTLDKNSFRMESSKPSNGRDILRKVNLSWVSSSPVFHTTPR